MCNSNYTQEEAESFSQAAKISGLRWVCVSALLILGLLWFIVAFVTWVTVDYTQPYQEDNVSGIFSCLVFSGLFFLLGILIFARSVQDSRHSAIDQCRFVAEKYSINMSPKDAHHIGISLYAGEVFDQFYLLIKESRPELIPEGFLEGSGGENLTASRRLVESLWNRYVEKADQPEAVADEGVSAVEAPAI